VASQDEIAPADATEELTPEEEELVEDANARAIEP
jgi:hypothetical protein